MYIKWLYTLISALTFRIRGGLRIYKDKKFPLNKFWFAVWFPTMNCLLRGWNPAFFVTGGIFGSCAFFIPKNEESTREMLVDYLQNNKLY